MNNILMQHLKIILSKNEMNENFPSFRGWQLTISRTFPSPVYVCGFASEMSYIFLWMEVLIIVTVCCYFLKISVSKLMETKTLFMNMLMLNIACMSELLSPQWMTFKEWNYAWIWTIERSLTISNSSWMKFLFFHWFFAQ